MGKGRMSSGQRYGIRPEDGPKGGPGDPQFEWFVDALGRHPVNETAVGTAADMSNTGAFSDAERGAVAIQTSIIVAYSGTEGEADRAKPVVDYQAFDPVANGV